MKSFVIKNDNEIIGYLFYYEKIKSFYIELNEDIDVKNIPIFFKYFYKKKIYSLDINWSKKWVQERVIPSDRQNISTILKNSKSEYYDEYKLLIKSKAKCSQDDCYIEKVKYNEILDSIKNRDQHRLLDVVPVNDNELICFFRNNEVKRCKMNKIDSEQFKFVLSSKKEFNNVNLQIDGRGVEWKNNIYISSEDLYKSGKSLDINYRDFISFVQNRLVNINEATKLVNCTRQNIFDLIKRRKIEQIRADDKNTLLLKKDLIKN